MTVRKRGSRWWYDFRISGVRHRGPIPEARTKAQAEQAEAKVRTEIFEGRYGRPLSRQSLKRFVEEVYLPWARLNKESWGHDEFRSRTLCQSESLRGKTLAEVTPQVIEKYKMERAKSTTQFDRAPSAGTINLELALLSRIMTMAVDNKLLVENPCAKVKHLPADSGRTRYLTAEEEGRLMQTSPMRRGLLRHIVTLAIQTGMRKDEILSLRWSHVDMANSLIFVAKPKCRGDKRKTKGIPMSADVRAVLLELQAKALALQSPACARRS